MKHICKRYELPDFPATFTIVLLKGETGLGYSRSRYSALGARDPEVQNLWSSQNKLEPHAISCPSQLHPSRILPKFPCDELINPPTSSASIEVLIFACPPYYTHTRARQYSDISTASDLAGVLFHLDQFEAGVALTK